MTRVLFVCVENSNRSQMAEAFARIHGVGVLEPFSAGSHPSGVVNPRAVKAMAELGYDLTVHTSKSLDEVPQDGYGYTITMGCGDACPHIAASQRLDWDLVDPKSLAPERFNKVRDDIRRRVEALIQAVGEGTEGAS